MRRANASGIMSVVRPHSAYPVHGELYTFAAAARQQEQMVQQQQQQQQQQQLCSPFAPSRISSSSSSRFPRCR